MKLGVKPFTLFLCIGVILFLILGTQFFFLKDNDRNMPGLFYKEKPTWKGIITLWDISYVETGTGSKSKWLNNWVKEFEKQHPGIYIDLRIMTPERVKAYFEGDINKEFSPDIISLDNYEQIVPADMLEDLSPFFTEQELSRMHAIAYQRVENDGKINGVPWMMGGYVLLFNQDMADERGILLDEMPSDFDTLGKLLDGLAHVKEETDNNQIVYGFCSYNTKYSRPLVCMFYDESGKIQNNTLFKCLDVWRSKGGIVPENLWGLSKREAYNLFLNGKSGVILGSTDIFYQVRKAQEQGNGFRVKVGNIPLVGRERLLQDQVSAFGVLKQEDKDKKRYCISLLKSLLSKEVQVELKQLGMFPVVNDIGEIYSDDPEMNQLEKNVSIYSWGPGSRYWDSTFSNDVGPN